MKANEFVEQLNNDLGKEAAMEVLRQILEETEKNIPPEKRRKITEMAILHNHIVEIVSTPEPVPLTMVRRFNELWKEVYGKMEESEERNGENPIALKKTKVTVAINKKEG